MRTILIVALACLCASGALAVTTKAGTACTATTNPWTATRCPLANCKKYDVSGTDQAGYSCSTAATGYNVFSQLDSGADTTGATSDYVCIKNCKTSTDTTIPCDASGLLCATCADNYAASGKPPTAASPQPCNCVKATTADATVSCGTCAHGYFGTDSSNVAVAPSSTEGTADSNYYNSYASASPQPTKCALCPTTLTNCAQCASLTTCAKCTTGNTLDTNGSCSAAKVFASIAFALVGIFALLF